MPEQSLPLCCPTLGAPCGEALEGHVEQELGSVDGISGQARQDPGSAGKGTFGKQSPGRCQAAIPAARILSVDPLLTQHG